MEFHVEGYACGTLHVLPYLFSIEVLALFVPEAEVGVDIGDWEGYSSDNPKFQYYKSAGYDYFCNVDSSQYFVQITDQYFRQGRRNLDGYRMYYNPDMLSDLFDVSEVWDSSRPTPVPEM